MLLPENVSMTIHHVPEQSNIWFSGKKSSQGLRLALILTSHLALQVPNFSYLFLKEGEIIGIHDAQCVAQWGEPITSVQTVTSSNKNEQVNYFI